MRMQFPHGALDILLCVWAWRRTGGGRPRSIQRGDEAGDALAALDDVAAAGGIAQAGEAVVAEAEGGHDGHALFVEQQLRELRGARRSSGRDSCGR